LLRAMNTVSFSGRSPCFTLSNLPAIPPPTTCRRLSAMSLVCDTQLTGGTGSRPPTSRGTMRLGLRLYLAGSPRRPAESSSSSCGLAVHLPLLPTPPHGDAVTFGYKVQTSNLDGDFHPADSTRSQAH
jgi:hypothetical protein